MEAGSAEAVNMPPPEIIEVEDRQDMHLRLAMTNEIAPLFEAVFSGQDVPRQQKIDEAIEATASGKRIQYQIIVGNDGEDTVVGSVVLYGKNVQEATAELSYYAAEEFRGNGYVTDAAKRIVRFGFEEWGLDRVFLEINPENTKSEAVAGRLGAVLTEKTSEDVVGSHKFPYRIWEIDKP